VNTPAEWDLILRCRRGSATAFEPLVRAHEAAALRMAGALLGDPDDAKDAVQDAFVKAYRSLGGMAEGSPFGPWFRAIVRNLCIDRLRSAPVRTRAALDPAAMDASAWTEPTGLDRLERAELAAAVRAALGTLSDEHRAVLVMKELEGLSYAEIATAAGIAPGTVASRLYHARAALRRAVTDAGITADGGQT
jgi:RNA polymerase sigma-70 factor, ECF subfamily